MSKATHNSRTPTLELLQKIEDSTSPVTKSVLKDCVINRVKELVCENQTLEAKLKHYKTLFDSLRVDTKVIDDMDAVMASLEADIVKEYT